MNGKRYVGITRQKPERRWAAHQYVARCRDDAAPLYQAIRKYGPERFRFEVVASAWSRRDLCAVEQALIVQFGIRAERGTGYNRTAGGDGAFDMEHSAETRAKQRARKLGLSQSPEHAAAISAALAGMLKSEAHRAKLRGRKRPDNVERLAGKPCPPETAAKISAANKGRRPAQHTIAAARAAWPKGSKQTPEARAEISAVQKGRPPSAATISASRAVHTGRSKSPEQRAKISAAVKRVWQARGAAAFGR